jgi:ABC-type microcin C transport system permease subunit YejB
LKSSLAVAVYLLKRLLLMIPTLFGILLVSFLVIRLAPGDSVIKLLARERRAIRRQGVSRTWPQCGGRARR